MPSLKRYEAVEVAIPTGSTNTRFYFPDLPNLRNAMIQAVQLYTAGSFSATPNTGSTMVTEADLKKAFPKELWNKLHLQIIFYGREYCPARGHDIQKCPICLALQ